MRPAGRVVKKATKKRKQVGLAQLSQRDRVAGWVSYGQKWKELGDNIYGHYRSNKSIFNHCDVHVFGQQSNRIRRKKTQNKVKSPKIIGIGINGKPVCDFLLVK